MDEEIFIVFIVIGLPIICGTLIVIAKILFADRKGSKPRKDGSSEVDDTRIIQELNRGLNRLEDRIEALETIISERQRRPGDPLRRNHEASSSRRPTENEL